MPEVMTYDSLKEDMRRYLERGYPEDTTVFDQIPRLIGLAQRQIVNTLKLQGFIDVVTANLVAGQSVYQKPNRWRETTSMSFGSGEDNESRVPLFPRSYEYCRAYWPNPSIRSSPMFYADYNLDFWLIVPTPVVTVPWEVIYYQIPALLDDSNQTNYLTDYAPNLLLYRCMIEMETFLKNDARLATWKPLYDEAMKVLDVQDLQKIVDRSVTRQEA